MKRNFKIIFSTGTSVFTSHTNFCENCNIEFFVIFSKCGNENLYEKILTNAHEVFDSIFNNERFYNDDDDDDYDEKEEHDDAKKNVIVSAATTEINFDPVSEVNFLAANTSSFTHKKINTKNIDLIKPSRQSILSSATANNELHANHITIFSDRVKSVFENGKHSENHTSHENGDSLLISTGNFSAKAVILNILEGVYDNPACKHQSNYYAKNGQNFETPFVYFLSADAIKSAVFVEIALNHIINQNPNQLPCNFTLPNSENQLAFVEEGIQIICARFTEQYVVDNDRRYLIKGNLLRNRTNETNIDQYTNILILGAGLAGLGAAYVTNQKDRDCTFLILEAQDRAGGRVHTTNLLRNHNKSLENAQAFSANLIETGAQWLHGRYNELYDISTKHNLLSTEQSDEGLGSFLYENRIEIDDFLVKRVDFIIGQILEECEEFAQLEFNANDFKHPKSVGDFLRDKFKNFLDSFGCPQQKKMARDLLDWHIRFQVIDNSCSSLDHVSAKFWGKYSYNGELCQAHYNYRSGFGDVTTAILSEMPKDCVKMSKEVVKVRIHNDLTLGHRVTVSCSDGSVYAADHVLITFPLGVLKAYHKYLFHPRLPDPIERTIMNMGFETINKIFLQFDQAWWGEVNGIQFVYDSNDSNATRWTRDISGFDILRPGPKNTLLGWIGGRGAIDMEQLTDQQIISDCLNLLSKFMKMSVPPPINYYFTRWASNRYANGAYSYISTDCDENETSGNVLKQPLLPRDFFMDQPYMLEASGLTAPSQLLRANNERAMNLMDAPVLLFAGEACHDKYFSTAHGAFLSGMEQAKQLLDFYE